MRIIHLSDTHIAHERPVRAEELAACVAHINAMTDRPDAVVHTGDVAHNGRPDEYDAAKSLLDGLSAPYFVLPGNRDDRRNLIDAFADGTFIRRGMPFAQYSVENFPTRLIVVDSASDRTNKGRLCDKRMAHIREMLEADTSRPACVFLHHPPFEVKVGPCPHHFDPWSDADSLAAELKRHDHVRGVYCGHAHRAFATALNGATASVVSCLATDLRRDEPAAAARGLPVFDIVDV